MAFASMFLMPSFAADLNLIPWPAHIDRGEGALALDQHISIQMNGADQRVRAAVARFITQLSARTGAPFEPDMTGAHPKLVVDCGGPGAAVQKPSEDESYRLKVDASQARLSAPNALGVLHGLETMLQLVEAGEQGWQIPAVGIEDKTRFVWRGLLIDVARHFMPLDVLERNMDGMAAVKLNVLHLHLSDDQGFRVESLRYPKLQQAGSDGLYYTQDQIRGLIAYARARGIRIVPEFDMPGHATSWLAGYPELASAPGPYQIIHRWSIQDPCLDPTNEATYQFLDGFIGEMAGLFPDEYFHIGGDEVNGKQWNANERIQAWMHEHGKTSNAALQEYFTERVQAIVAKHGKRMAGWDEILDPALPKDILIQSWRGQKSLAQAAQAGYRGILSAGYYLDLMMPAAEHYAVDPFANESTVLNDEQRARILGGEAAEWSEYATPENIDGRLWPRLGAIAERLWSPAEVKDPVDMYRRLTVLSADLEWLGLKHRANYRRMLDRLAGNGPRAPLEALAGVVEPVKGYAREHVRQYFQDTPLNRMVDTVPPESDVAREFNALAARVKADPEVRPRVRLWLAQWRGNDEELRPALEKSFLLEELIPVSQNLSTLATVGIDALSAIEHDQPLSPEASATQLAAVDAASKPHAELLLMIAPGVKSLVMAASQGAAPASQ